jgi:hypothetical protein
VGGSVISDSRILADDGETVVIGTKNYREGGRFEPLARANVPALPDVQHEGSRSFTARQLAAFLLQLRFFWRRCTTVIVTLPYDRRAFATRRSCSGTRHSGWCSRSPP